MRERDRQTEGVKKDHGRRTYHVWEEVDDGAACIILLIDGDPPSRHLIKNAKILHSFEAMSYHEARVKQSELMGWNSPDEEDFEYPPDEFLE